MAKPKLGLIPSAQGSKFYSVLPSSGVGDFDFTRSGSATRINSQGLIETVGNGVSRLNYPLIDGKVVGCPHHILEPQSTNQIINSENLSDSSWGKTNAVIDSNSTISPDGTQNADRINFSISSGFGRIQKTSLSSVNSVSFFIKHIDLDYILFFCGGSSRGNYINIKEGYVTSTTLGGGMDIVIKKYPNDWLRIEASDANNGTSLEIYAANSTPTYSPITSNGSFYLWGCQAETNSYPTSYIPTNGSAVTRSAETANGSGDADTFNDSEGVLMAEIANSETTTGSYLGICNGSSNERLIIGNEGGLLRVYTDVFVSGSVQSANKDFNKIAVKYNSSNTSIYYNGFLIKSINQSANLSGINELKFTSGGNAQNFYGNTKQLQYYDSALTDSELETLTSWVSFSDMAEGQLYTIE